ncbi:hypothetical protein BJY04DRAFT_224366 [Aspergillus karnatakaensis]|uniref:uncharacterized protein n=1 Tax=Aspergillus karnatakaensis TaxID=1810916 RepID=UPI003CCDC599
MSATRTSTRTLTPLAPPTPPPTPQPTPSSSQTSLTSPTNTNTTLRPFRTDLISPFHRDYIAPQPASPATTPHIHFAPEPTILNSTQPSFPKPTGNAGQHLQKPGPPYRNRSFIPGFTNLLNKNIVLDCNCEIRLDQDRDLEKGAEGQMEVPTQRVFWKQRRLCKGCPDWVVIFVALLVIGLVMAGVVLVMVSNKAGIAHA